MATLTARDLAEGQDVRVQDRSGSYPGRVLKVGRDWVTIKYAHTTDRFRIDSQAIPNRTGVGVRFWTLEQWGGPPIGAAHEIKSKAFAYLQGQGITVERHSPWYGRETALVDLLRKGDPDDDSGR